MIARLDSALLLAKAHNKSIAHRVKANSGDEARDTEVVHGNKNYCYRTPSPTDSLHFRQMVFVIVTINI